MIPLKRASIDDTFERLLGLLSSVASGMGDIGGEKATADTIWACLKEKLLGEQYTLYVQNAPKDLERAIRGLVKFLE